MSIEGYTIREMTRQELDLAISWANSEGWNPGIHDAKTFYITDPNGFFLGILEGKPVASISAVAYEDSFGFLGFYIVQPQLRGMGLGREIWNAGMKHLEGRNIGLDGVMEQQKLYERKGFWPCYKSIRHQGAGTGLKGSIELKGRTRLKGKKGPENKAECMKYLSEVPAEDLLAYDDQFFPVPRHVFIRSWIKQPGVTAIGALNGGDLAGYGVLRECYQGYKIGPLFADDKKVADALFCALCDHAPRNAPVFLDTPEPNTAALDLARRHHMQPVFETVRMYTKEDPGLPMERIFGVTSFELG
jgi:GNAT superfamily N-acetyltransferase